MLHRFALLAVALIAVTSVSCSGSDPDSPDSSEEPTSRASATRTAAEPGTGSAGLTAAAVTGALKKGGFECGGPSTFDASGEAMNQWDCTRRGDAKGEGAFPSRRVSIVGKDATHIRAVVGAFVDARPSPDTTAALEFFKETVSATLPGSSTAVLKWLDANAAAGGQTTIGGAGISVVPMRELRITLPEGQ